MMLSCVLLPTRSASSSCCRIRWERLCCPISLAGELSGLIFIFLILLYANEWAFFAVTSGGSVQDQSWENTNARVATRTLCCIMMSILIAASMRQRPSVIMCSTRKRSSWSTSKNFTRNQTVPLRSSRVVWLITSSSVILSHDARCVLLFHYNFFISEIIFSARNWKYSSFFMYALCQSLASSKTRNKM